MASFFGLICSMPAPIEKGRRRRTKLLFQTWQMTLALALRQQILIELVTLDKHLRLWSPLKDLTLLNKASNSQRSFLRALNSSVLTATRLSRIFKAKRCCQTWWTWRRRSINLKRPTLLGAHLAEPCLSSCSMFRLCCPE